MTDQHTAPLPRPIRFGADELPPGITAPTDDGWLPPEDPTDTDDDPGAVSATAGFLDWLRARLPRVEGSRREHPWCPTWWVHPEVVDRLFALWCAYTESSTALDNRAMSSWWVDHWDRHTATLFAENGPFRHCTPDTHHKYEASVKPAVAFTEPPTGWEAFPVPPAD